VSLEAEPGDRLCDNTRDVTRDDRRAPRRDVPLTVLAVAITLGTGAMDVVSFTRLGGVFSSVMTGNLVLLGLAAARPSGELAATTTPSRPQRHVRVPSVKYRST
jgi:Protein of unknown function (DUF1275)